MKKIISLFAAVAMLVTASSSVFAAALDNFPVGYAPKGAVTLTQTDGADADGYYTYQLKIDLTDLGTLTNTYASKKYSGIRIGQVSFDIRGVKSMDIMKSTITGALGNGFGNTMDYTGSDASGINFMFTTTDVGVAYPAGLDWQNKTTTTCPGALVLEFYAKQGTMTISNPVIGYSTYLSGALDPTYQTSRATLALDKTSFTIGETASKLGMDVSLQVHNQKGYIWKADVTKGGSNPTSLTADFEASNGALKTSRTVKDLDKLTSKFAGAGSTTFNIGLKTTKELSKATFTITNSDAADNTVSVDAPLN